MSMENNLNNFIQELVQEIEKELEEATVSANVAGYNTPKAFSDKGKKVSLSVTANQKGSHS